MNIPHPAKADAPVQQLWVHKTDLTQTRLHTLARSRLISGQIRLTINAFALTANNITYAAFGEAMNYWGFYPSGDATWGIVPVWGFATVLQSECEGVEVGAIFYGYYPMANELVLTPSKLKTTGFIDSAPHRESLHAVYNQYHRTSLDAFHSSAQSNTEHSDALEALLRPLFLTSWLIDDFFATESFFGANVAILSSASSKTAYGTAYCLKQRPGLEVIGLTSAANLDFCNRLGCYDRVLSYAQLSSIQTDARCVYIDFAGNAALRMAVHERFSNLAYSSSIGGTHVTQLGSGKGLAGPKVVLFFAPAQSAKRISEWGATLFGQRIVSAWHGFIEAVSSAQPPWLVPQFHRGAPALIKAYQTVLAGHDNPRHGHILSF